jgi:hypothetical protein
MPEPIEYWNLVTGDRAPDREYKRDYFELEIVAQTFSYRYSTSEGEFLCAYASEPNFYDAWTQALSHTLMGWHSLIRAREWELDRATIDKVPFDPYAGNLDVLLGY